MKDWKTWKIVGFIALCICLNVCIKLVAVHFELPLWADSFGTALCACIAGPFCGALVGVTGNLAYCVVNNLSAAYALTSIALGVIVGIAARHKWFDHFYGFMKVMEQAQGKPSLQTRDYLYQNYGNTYYFEYFFLRDITYF